MTENKFNTDQHDLQEDMGDHDGLRYDDGSLSPILIPFEEAGYLLSLATTDEKVA